LSESSDGFPNPVTSDSTMFSSVSAIFIFGWLVG
jgi:hypothetical protein